LYAAATLAHALPSTYAPALDFRVHWPPFVSTHRFADDDPEGGVGVGGVAGGLGGGGGAVRFAQGNVEVFPTACGRYDALPAASNASSETV
jgi:hypothetical protein